MRTLLIDNYDSFTYNLFHLVGEIAGEPPRVVRNDELTSGALQGIACEAIIVSPGPGRPERARDFGISADAILQRNVPVLGICLGHQGIAHLFGGKVVHAPTPMHGRVSEIFHRGDRLFEGIPNPMKVVRYHSLMVDDLPPALRVTASTRDGIVMALEHTDRPIYGVQFHPESICAEAGPRVLENFARLVRERTPSNRTWSTASPRAAQSASSAAGATQSVTAQPRLRTSWVKLDVFPAPAASFRALFASHDKSFWLDSSMAVDGLSRFSFMGDGSGPLSHLVDYDVQAGTLRVSGAGGVQEISSGFFDHLNRRLADDRTDSGGLPFDFNGGYVGYIGYEMKKECGAQSPHASAVPDAQLLFADRLVAFDHREHHVYLVCVDEVAQDGARATAWLADMEKKLRALSGGAELSAAEPGSPVEPPDFRLRHPRAAYIDRIDACQRFIADGESYEVCLTTQVLSAARPDPLALYEELRRRNPAPYAAYLRYLDLHVLSSSPERFLKIDRARTAESKPIKGTQRRGRTAAEDRQLRQELVESEKNRAENLMIVDLVRNDLGRVCELGSVRVPKLMAIEEYATVHQMVSTVVGKLRDDVSSVDAFRAAFPGGSMTGAPKLRTMEIIDQLEEAPRGIYSGAIGYFGLCGTCDFNIVIRTIQVTEAGLSIGVGGAIVALSDPGAEFDEIMLKAEAPMRSISAVLPVGHAADRHRNQQESPNEHRQRSARAIPVP